jgi:hypothetical protein
MADPMDEAEKGALRLDFDRRLTLQFRGSAITTDVGLLVYREQDDTLSFLVQPSSFPAALYLLRRPEPAAANRRGPGFAFTAVDGSPEATFNKREHHH